MPHPIPAEAFIVIGHTNKDPYMIYCGFDRERALKVQSAADGDTFHVYTRADDLLTRIAVALELIAASKVLPNL